VNLTEIESASNNLTPTSCPDCFRPKTEQISDEMIELPFSETVLPKQPLDFFTPRLNTVQNLSTSYLIHPNVCAGGQQPYLLAVQMSVISRSEDRDAVRRTWGSVARHHTWPKRRVNAVVRVVFVVARQPTAETGVADSPTETFRRRVASMKQLEDINKEGREFGDILYLDMIDSYRNLTLKVLSAFKWAELHCRLETKFILKVDLDTFVNVPLLVDVLMRSERRLEYSILGYVYHRGSSPVHRAGPWAVDEAVYPMHVYPEYASGCAYVLSYKVLAKMADTAPYVPMVDVEDAFITGVLRYVTGCRLFSLPERMTHYLDRSWAGCSFYRDEKIAGTGANKTKMAALWDMFNNDGKGCG
ncbi:unnamed protein product, partial [Lymnaea stagnalis]